MQLSVAIDFSLIEKSISREEERNNNNEKEKLGIELRK